VAGVGSIGQCHIRNLRARLGDRVEILAYRVRGQNYILSETLQIESADGVDTIYDLQTFDSLDKALEKRPDAVFVCNPTSLHLQVALDSARAGCHLLIEKPLSNTYDGVGELIDLVERNNLVAMVGYQMRFHPGLQRVRTLLDQRVIGHVLSVQVEVAEHLPDAHPYEDYRQSYAARSDLGGGVILSYIHELDYVYWLFGLPLRVFAAGGHLSTLELDVEDTADITMQCLVDGESVPVHVHQDFVQRPPRRTCRVIGDAGAIMLDFAASTLTIVDSDGRQREHREFDGLSRNQLFVNELDHFLGCLARQQEPVVTVRDGAQSLRMALAARESLATGTVVELT
jgi:predicted dehydrogenase